METPEADIKNAQMTLASIRSDTQKAVADLELVLEAKKRAESDVQEARSIAVEAQNGSTRALQELTDERARMRLERKAHEDWMARSKKELDVLKAQKSDAMSELKRINEWIFSGEATKRELDMKIDKINLDLLTYETLANQIVDLRDQVHLESAERDRTRLETRLSLDELEIGVHRLTNEKEAAEKALHDADHERERQEALLNDARNEQVRIKADLAVIIARVEEKFGEAFPDLQMKL